METKAKKTWWLLPAALWFAAGFAVAARWDLAIDQALYSPENLMARLFEAFGWLPAFLPALLLTMLWAAEGRATLRRRWQMPMGLVLALAGGTALCYVCYHYLEKRGLAGGGPGNPRGWLWLALALALFIAAFVWVMRQGAERRKKLFFFAYTGTAFLCLNLALTNLLKLLWQRPRFDEMLAGGSLAAFRPWFLPFGAGGSSFPSGHVANACGVFLLLVLCDVFPALGRHRGLVTIVCWGFLSLMALSRILIGRHFLSDTLAAAGLVALLFFFLHRSKSYRRGLARVLDAPIEGEA